MGERRPVVVTSVERRGGRHPASLDRRASRAVNGLGGSGQLASLPLAGVALAQQVAPLPRQLPLNPKDAVAADPTLPQDPQDPQTPPVDDVTPQLVLSPDSLLLRDDAKRDLFLTSPRLVGVEIVLPDLANSALRMMLTPQKYKRVYRRSTDQRTSRLT